MSGPARLALFAALLAAVFVAATAAGGLIDPSGASTSEGADRGGQPDDAGETTGHAGDEGDAAGTAAADPAPPGLEVAAAGLRLVPAGAGFTEEVAP